MGSPDVAWLTFQVAFPGEGALIVPKVTLGVASLTRRRLDPDAASQKLLATCALSVDGVVLAVPPDAAAAACILLLLLASCILHSAAASAPVALL